MDQVYRSGEAEYPASPAEFPAVPFSGGTPCANSTKHANYSHCVSPRKSPRGVAAGSLRCLYFPRMVVLLTVGAKYAQPVAARRAEGREFPLLLFLVVFLSAFLLFHTVILTGVLPQALWT